MPTTTNFGWTTPADTDLVSAGASAMRTLGSGIDTSLVDLKGGSTGQALVKNSATDLDYVWEANGWYQLATSSLTTSTTNLSSIPTTYKDLRIVVNGYTQNTVQTTAFLRIGTGSASATTYVTTKNPFSGTWTGSTSATDLLGSGYSVATATNTDFIVDIYQYAETNLAKAFKSYAQNSVGGLVCFGQWTTTTAINYVSFVAGVTPTAGTITVYGRM
jgi:hypothetical protein